MIDNMEIEVIFNSDKKGIEVKFKEKPKRELLEQLKFNGFRWSKKQELWYAKDTEEGRRFIEQFIDEAIHDKFNSSIEYPVIDIEDIESYVVDERLSKRENEGHWIFRSEEKDHQSILRKRMRGYNDALLSVLEGCTDEHTIYKAKKWLQSFKKRYYKWFINELSLKANNPSWAVTGRAGRNINKDRRYNDRMDNLMKEYTKLSDEFTMQIQKISRDSKKIS